MDPMGNVFIVQQSQKKRFKYKLKNVNMDLMGNVFTVQNMLINSPKEVNLI